MNFLEDFDNVFLLQQLSFVGRLSVQLLLVIVLLPLISFSVKNRLSLLLFFLLFANTANWLAVLRSLCLKWEITAEKKASWTCCCLLLAKIWPLETPESWLRCLCVCVMSQGKLSFHGIVFLGKLEKLWWLRRSPLSSFPAKKTKKKTVEWIHSQARDVEAGWHFKSSCDDQTAASRLRLVRSLWRWGNTGELRLGRRKLTLATIQMLWQFTTVTGNSRPQQEGDLVLNICWYKKFRVQFEVRVPRRDRGMFLLLSSRYGARRGILESVTTAHLAKLDSHLHNCICTVRVSSDSEGQRFHYPGWSVKRELIL